MMTPDMDERYRKEVAQAFVATRHLRIAVWLSALLGLAAARLERALDDL